LGHLRYVSKASPKASFPPSASQGLELTVELPPGGGGGGLGLKKRKLSPAQHARKMKNMRLELRTRGEMVRVIVGEVSF
jgi:hypothetical protein